MPVQCNTLSQMYKYLLIFQCSCSRLAKTLLACSRIESLLYPNHAYAGIKTLVAASAML